MSRVVGDILARPDGLQPTGLQRDQRRILIGLQQREHVAVDTGQTIIEGQQHRIGRQRLPSLAGINDLLQRNRPPPLPLHPVKPFHQPLRADGVRVRIPPRLHVVAYIVIGKREEVPIRDGEGVLRMH